MRLPVVNFIGKRPNSTLLACRCVDAPLYIICSVYYIGGIIDINLSEKPSTG